MCFVDGLLLYVVCWLVNGYEIIVYFGLDVVVVIVIEYVEVEKCVVVWVGYVVI